MISFLIVSLGVPSFAPFFGPIAACVGYAFFWKSIEQIQTAKVRFWISTLWFGGCSLLQLSWMTAIEYQGIYILFVWLALSVWVGIQFGLLTLLVPKGCASNIQRMLAIASLWTLFEWGRYYLLCGYSWYLVGISYCHTYAIQFASVFGILGLSFWVILSNLFALNAINQKKMRPFVMWGIIAIFPYLYGAFHLYYHDQKMKKAPTLSCLLLQTGLLPPEKVPLEGHLSHYISAYQQWGNILHYIKDKVDSSIDLIVLPEAALPYFSEQYVYDPKIVVALLETFYGKVSHEMLPPMIAPYGEERTQKVSNLYFSQLIANYLNSEVVLGLDHVDEGGRAYNSAFHCMPHANEVGRYDKRVLMPLAEYLPFRFLLPLVASYGITDFFTPGKEAILFPGKVCLSPTICYEETFPHKVREGRLRGGKLFVNLTNDGWYPFSRLPSQHLEHAKFRAIENGIPILRSCNTGVTAIVDSLGRGVERLEQEDKEGEIQKGALYAAVSLYEYKPLFLMWGNWGIVSMSFISIGFFFVFTGSRRIKFNSTTPS